MSFDGDYASRAFIYLRSSCKWYADDIEVETRCGDFDLIAFPYNVEADEVSTSRLSIVSSIFL